MHTIAHPLVVYARVLEAYNNSALMYTEDHILPVLPIKDLIKKDGKPTIQFNLATGAKPSVSYVRVLFCP